VYSKNSYDGQRNCSKHVEFYSKNKFEKLVHLVGFNIRIYHDARAPEPQMLVIIISSSSSILSLLSLTSLSSSSRDESVS